MTARELPTESGSVILHDGCFLVLSTSGRWGCPDHGGANPTILQRVGFIVISDRGREHAAESPVAIPPSITNPDDQPVTATQLVSALNAVSDDLHAVYRLTEDEGEGLILSLQLDLLERIGKAIQKEVRA